MPEPTQATRRNVNDILRDSSLYQQAVADNMTVFTFFDQRMGNYISIATDKSFDTREDLLNYVLSNANDNSKVRVFRPDRDYSYAERELQSIAWDAQSNFMFDRIALSMSQGDLERMRTGRSIPSLRPDQMDEFRQMLNDYLGQAPSRTPERMIGMSWEEIPSGMSLSTRFTEAGPVLTFSSQDPQYSMDIHFKDATVAQQFVEDLAQERGDLTAAGTSTQAIWDLENLRAVLSNVPRGNITSISNVQLGPTMDFNEFTQQDLISGIDRFLARNRS